MSFPVLTIAVLVFAALCALVGYVLHRNSREAESRPIEDSEKLSLGRMRTRAVLMGIVIFFAAFFLSLPLTVTWARRHWPGDGQAVLGAFWPSVGIAAISAICCSIYLLMKANIDSNKDKR